MANFSNSASAKTALAYSSGSIETKEAYVLALTKGLDRVFKREFDEPLAQAMQYVFERSAGPGVKDNYKLQSYRELGGIVPQNRDTDDLPFITSADGFGVDIPLYTYRSAIAIERRLEEIDDVGVTRQKQRGLAKNAMRTTAAAIADAFNRGVNPTNAPFLCDDGMYLVDSSRPNANPAGGTWSNEETASAITPASIFTAQLNARKTTDENGNLAPLSIQKIMCRPDDEKVLWEIKNSAKEPTTALNRENWHVGKWDYAVFDYLTDAAIYYWLCDPKSEDNELQFIWGSRPTFKTWDDGSNPDIMNQRVRFVFGLGCGCPKKALRGGEVS